VRRAYALRGDVSRELLSYRGQVLVHGDRAELEFLIPYGAKTVEVNLDRLGRPYLWIRHHPEMTWVTWPLRKEDFRDAR